MRILIWAGLFLLLTVAGTTAALAAMIGMPIADTFQFGLFALAALIGGWGIVLLASTPVAPLRLAVVNARADRARPAAYSANDHIALDGQGVSP